MDMRGLLVCALAISMLGCEGGAAECEVDGDCRGAPWICRRSLCIDPRPDAAIAIDGGGGDSGVVPPEDAGHDASSADASSADASSTDASTPHVRDHLLLEAGFEGDDPFAAFHTQACCERSIQQSDAHARSGTHSFRAEVRASDPSVSSGYRAELLPRGVTDEGERWYGFSVLFEVPDEDGVWDTYNGHLVQWHPDNATGSASLSLWASGGVWDVATNPRGERGETHHEVPEAGPITTGVWHDVVFHVDWEASLVEVWVDGERIARLEDERYTGQYFKLGMNRWGSGPGGAPDDTWVIYYDDLRIGDELATYDDVAP